MKSLLLALLLLGAAPALQSAAQSAPPPAAATGPYEYCTLICEGRVSGPVKVVYADGRGRRSLGDDTLNKNEKKAGLQQFNSNMDALKFMTDQGWEVMQQTVLPPETGILFVELHYLLRRPKPQG